MLTVIETTSPSRAPALLDGLMTGPQLEAETGWKERTRLRREEEGLPYILLGRTKLYPTVLVRKWILARLERRTAPRHGRPSEDGVTMLTFPKVSRPRGRNMPRRTESSTSPTAA